MKITSLFLLIMILVNISAEKVPQDTQLIACDSTSKGHLSSTNNTYDFFEFTLNASSYVKISTCGSNFDTYLVLINSNLDIIYKNNDDFSSACGFNAVIDTDKKLDIGTYLVEIYAAGVGVEYYGDYVLALQCDEKGIPTIPEAIGIPVQSDCNFVSAFTKFTKYNLLDQGIKPLDVCSIQSTTIKYAPISRKYICNVAGDGVLMISYDNDNCSGTGSVSPIEGKGATYYFNCIGSSDNCDIGTLNGVCEDGKYVFSSTFVVNQCVGGNMISCNTGDIAFENYFDDNCVNFTDSSIVSDNEDCTFISECDIFTEPITTDAPTPAPDAQLIACDSTSKGHVSTNNTYDIFQFTLNTSSYVKISTCGSNFDTELILVNSSNFELRDIIYENNDVFNSSCGFNAVINTDKKLNVGTYFVFIHGADFHADYGDYVLALQCDKYAIPTIPEAISIPVQSDCNFVGFEHDIKPLDVCSIQTGTISRKFICNVAGDGVLMISYDNDNCSGTGSVSPIDAERETYYFNCIGSSDNCNIGTLNGVCKRSFSLTYVVDQCAGGNMISCNTGDIAFENYFDDNCVNYRNSSIFSDYNKFECTYVSECSGNIFTEPTTTEELPNCIQYGCGIAFECDLVSGECLRDCNILAIDEYLLQCSNEFRSQESVINNLQTKINDLELQLLTVKQIVDALGAQKKEKKEKKSETVPFILFTGDNYLKDMLVVLLCIINVLVVMYLCYDKRTKGGKGYVDVKRYIDEEEVSLQN